MNGQDLMEQEAKMEEIRNGIHARFPEVKWPEPILEPIFFGRLSKTVIPGRKAVMDANTGKVWDIVSDDYGLLPHEKVLHDIIMGLPPEMGTPAVKNTLWKDGARFRAEISFPEIEKDAEIKVGDIVRPRMCVNSSYDRSTLHEIQLGAEQLVCGNGLVTFVENEKKKRRHINGSTVTPEQLAKLAENFIEEYSISTDRWRKWAETKLSKIQFTDVLEGLPFTEAEREKLIMLPLMNNDNKMLSQLEAPTLWDVNSAATQFAKHVVRGQQRSIELETDIAQAMDVIERGL